MAAPAWSATDGSGNLAYKWAEQASGSALRLSLLRIHISEVTAAISTGNYSNTKGSRDKDAIEKYLEFLHGRESEEASAAGAAAGTRSYFTRGRAI